MAWTDMRFGECPAGFVSLKGGEGNGSALTTVVIRTGGRPRWRDNDRVRRYDAQQPTGIRKREA